MKLPMIVTDPGCDRPEHRDEVRGAMLALALTGGRVWYGPTDMDCGCVLQLMVDGVLL